jgi:protein involved in polysaccharide export with SLBB domain
MQHAIISLKRRSFLLIVTGVLAAAACAHDQSVPARHEPEPVVGFDERLGIDDVMQIRLLAEPDLSGDYRVGIDGTVDFPYIGRVQALGMRPSELQAELTRKLKEGYFVNPQLGLVVTAWNSRKISVLGQVSKPGPLQYQYKMTIVDAIAAAGGFTPSAAKNSVRLRREVKGKVETRTFRLTDISEGRSPNVTMVPGDILVVDERIF